MDGIPGSYAIVVFPPRLLRLILQEGRYAWSRRQRLFTDTERLRRRIVRGWRAQGNCSSQHGHDTWPDHPSSLQLACVLKQSHSSGTAPKREITHCALTVSEPMLYQPSSCRPSMANRIAGCPVHGSSIATRKL